MGDLPKEEWSWSDSDGEDGAPQRAVPRRRPGPSATPTPSGGQRALCSTPAAEPARISSPGAGPRTPARDATLGLSSSGISQQQRPESAASPAVQRSPQQGQQPAGQQQGQQTQQQPQQRGQGRNNSLGGGPSVGGMRAAVQAMVGQGLCTPQQADMFLRAAASENHGTHAKSSSLLYYSQA